MTDDQINEILSAAMERAAQICEEWAVGDGMNTRVEVYAATECAAAIRAAAASHQMTMDDPACTCGSDSPRAFNHALSCPHSTPWNERVKARTAGG